MHRVLVYGSGDKIVRLWDTTTGALQQTLKGHLDWIQSVAFSPDGRLLASGSDDMTVRLWDTLTGALQQTFGSHSSWVWSVAFSPDGWLLASGSGDKTVRLWDTTTGSLQQTWVAEGTVTSIEFSQCGSFPRTNLGTLDIQSRCGNHASKLPHSNLNISIMQDQWITVDGQRVLWLPPESRPRCLAIKYGVLALAHA